MQGDDGDAGRFGLQWRFNGGLACTDDATGGD